MSDSGSALQRGLGGMSQSFSVAYNTALQHNLEAQVNEERKRQFDAEAPVRQAAVDTAGANVRHLGAVDANMAFEQSMQGTPEEAAQTRSLGREATKAQIGATQANTSRTVAETPTADEISLRRDLAKGNAGMALTQTEAARQNLAAAPEERRLRLAAMQSEIDDRAAQNKYRDNTLKMQAEQNSAQRLQWQRENDVTIMKLANEATAAAARNAELETGRRLRHAELAYSLAPHILQSAVNSGMSFTAARDEATNMIQKLAPGIEVTHDAKAFMSLSKEDRSKLSAGLQSMQDPSLSWEERMKAAGMVNTISRSALPNMSADENQPPPPPPPPADSRPSAGAESRAARTLVGQRDKLASEHLQFAQEFEAKYPEEYASFLQKFSSSNSIKPEDIGAKFGDFAKWLAERFPSGMPTKNAFGKLWDPQRFKG